MALKYGARNALLPSVTGFALSLGALIGGSVLVEQIFDYPGMGRLLSQATSNRDYPLMQAILLLMIMAVLIANLVADLLYGVLDPAPGRRPEMTTSVPVPADAGGQRLAPGAGGGSALEGSERIATLDRPQRGSAEDHAA